MSEQQQHIFICSDSVGETADKLVQATIRQFEANQVDTRRFSHIKNEDEIHEIIKAAADSSSFIAYTLVQPELRKMMKEESIKYGIRAVDIMGPMMQAFIDTFHGLPKSQPGLLHTLDEDYFRRVDAIEFTVKCDDGRDTNAMLDADIVLIGVSRTSKTPLSIYLAHKGYKVANLPLIPEVKIPHTLFEIPSVRIVGLTMDAEKILSIRQERLKSVGLPYGARYATLERVVDELEYAHQLMEKLSCYVIDVTDKAIEEMAGMIVEHRKY